MAVSKVSPMKTSRSVAGFSRLLAALDPRGELVDRRAIPRTQPLVLSDRSCRATVRADVAAIAQIEPGVGAQSAFYKRNRAGFMYVPGLR